MSSITELKDALNTKTLNLYLLAIATGGIYPIIWISNNIKSIESTTKKKIIDDNFIIWIAVCVGLGMSLAAAGIGLVFSLASIVLYAVWAFRVKSALQEYALNEHKVDLKMNAFYTFLFNVYYINYCINDLPEVKRKQDILSDRTMVSES